MDSDEKTPLTNESFYGLKSQPTTPLEANDCTEQDENHMVLQQNQDDQGPQHESEESEDSSEDDDSSASEASSRVGIRIAQQLAFDENGEVDDMQFAAFASGALEEEIMKIDRTPRYPAQAGALANEAGAKLEDLSLRKMDDQSSSSSSEEDSDDEEDPASQAHTSLAVEEEEDAAAAAAAPSPSRRGPVGRTRRPARPGQRVQRRRRRRRRRGSGGRRRRGGGGREGRRL
mmetsp:Transcript_45729/g.79001  ORF Transcript_45729/g.79001 Transcript_45729/m.79001 type:complete len:231 (-) Transcript_45729:638-1330(-)